MPTSRPFLTLLAALPLACTTSPGTSTADTTEPSTSTASTSTAGATTHADASTHAEPTGTTHAHATTTGTTGHAHTGETTHAGTAGTTGEPSAIDVYCACMLENCHDEYHATWGEDHEASEAMCAAAAAAVPSVGVPATMGNSLECRQHYCELGEPVPGACASALGGGACVD